jgi:hypothetical protein
LEYREHRNFELGANKITLKARSELKVAGMNDFVLQESLGEFQLCWFKV